jgi:hypothetical protein
MHEKCTKIACVCARCGKTTWRVLSKAGPYCSQACYRGSTQAERFWAKVDQRADCWLWLGARNATGYGHAILNGKQTTAQRVAWELTHGPIPAGQFALHRCDNPSCVRPSHLFLGTHQDNMADMVGKGRAASGERSAWHLYPDRVPRGEANGMSKLTADKVRAIRSQHAQRIASLAVIAAMFGVSRSTAKRIVRRDTWRHIQ